MRQDAERVAALVRDAGGHLVGRTRLQKLAFLLSITGLDDGWRFGYKHYGPYSEALADGARYAHLLGLVKEVEKPTSWGGVYSDYSVNVVAAQDVPLARRRLAETAAKADAIELELAATAAFLSKEGHPDPWDETERRKPEKAENGRLERAKVLYRRLSEIETPIPLPRIV